MARWHSLYLASADQATPVTAIQHHLEQQGFTLYDAFSLLPGRSYPQALKCFVAPAAGAWVRILLEYSDDTARLEAALSQHAICMSAQLAGDAGTLALYASGNPHPISAYDLIAPHLPADVGREDYQRLLESGYKNIPDLEGENERIGSVKIKDLPDDLRRAARSIGGKKADNLFGKLTRRLLGGDTQAADILRDGADPDWNSEAGKRIQALFALLGAPANWREPDFPTLRQAYMLHRRRERKPNAPSYPGDEVLLAAVPDALAYVPVYGGKGA